MAFHQGRLEFLQPTAVVSVAQGRLGPLSISIERSSTSLQGLEQCPGLFGDGDRLHLHGLGHHRRESASSEVWLAEEGLQPAKMRKAGQPKQRLGLHGWYRR